MEAAILGAAKKVEAVLDEEIERLDHLVDDDLETIRRNRLAQMKQEAENIAKWRRAGHGNVRSITEKDFFEHAKQSERMVCMFHRSGVSRFAQDFQEHVARVAERHLETLFVVIDAEKAQFLCTKFKIRMLPSILLVINGQINRVLHGLDEIDPSGKFDTMRLEQALFDLHMLTNTRIADEQK